MVLKFKNVGDAIHAQKRADRGGELVETGGVFEVDGELAEETPDAYLVGTGDDARAWPKAQWELVADKTAKTVAKDKD